MVATFIHPSESTASESNKANSDEPCIKCIALCIPKDLGPSISPGPEIGYPHKRPGVVSATYTISSSGERPTPFALSIGKTTSLINVPSILA